MRIIINFNARRLIRRKLFSHYNFARCETPREEHTLFHDMLKLSWITPTVRKAITNELHMKRNI